MVFDLGEGVTADEIVERYVLGDDITYKLYAEYPITQWKFALKLEEPAPIT